MSAPALWTIDAMAQRCAPSAKARCRNRFPGFRSTAAPSSRAKRSSPLPATVATAMTSSRRRSRPKPRLAVVAADRRGQFPADAPLLVVPDVLAALRDLAVAARARFQGKVIGVTGSVGKTGTKEALRLALSKDGETHASIASYNNHWGVPLSLARCPASARYAVFEMGMNHEGEIEPLTRLVRPHVAIITTIAPVHLEFLGTLAKIADAKAEIFLGIEPGGAAILNPTSPSSISSSAAPRRPASRASSRSARTRKPMRASSNACCRRAARPSKPISSAPRLTYKIGAPGRHLVSNSLAVLAAVELVGADLALGALALGELNPVVRPRRADRDRAARRFRARHRRQLQRQSGFGRRGARRARPGDGRSARPPHRRPRRHAGTRAERPRAASRPRRRRRRQCGRSGILLRSADACAVAGSSREPPRRLCRRL